MMLILFPYLFPLCNFSCLCTREKSKTGPNSATLPYILKEKQKVMCGGVGMAGRISVQDG
jgi:hypothetical protein